MPPGLRAETAHAQAFPERDLSVCLESCSLSQASNLAQDEGPAAMTTRPETREAGGSHLRARIYVMSVSLEGACAHIWYPSWCARGTCASIARLWLPAGLVRADPTGPDETEKEFLGDDPPKPQCRDAN